MSPSSRNVGRPANASFQRGAFGFADRDHLFLRASASARGGRPVHHVCRWRRDIETRSFPNSLVATPRDLTFYVADPISSIRARYFALVSFFKCLWESRLVL